MRLHRAPVVTEQSVDTHLRTRPHVVIVGGGFAGLSAAKALRNVAVDITLIDRTNHYLFQPLLYQVATGVLSPADVAVPTRFLLRDQENACVRLASVRHIDVRRRLVQCDDGAAISYHYLVVATGARHAYSRHPEWEPMAPGLKTLEDAGEIRRRFLLAFEEAEKTTDRAEQLAHLTFVIVGGGPTGVELAGILPTIARRGIRGDFRHVNPACTRVLLLESGPRILPTFPEPLSARAQRDLESLGVEVRTNAKVTHVSASGVSVGRQRIAARTVFWAAGNVASPLVASLGVATDRAGRALVEPDLSMRDYPEVFVVGDAAAVPLESSRPQGDAEGPPRHVPGLAAAANQMGEHVARTIARGIAGQPRQPFRYRDKGVMAVIGRGRAIADFGRFTLTGRVAWVAWLLVHLAYLAGFRNRLSVLIEWAYAYFTDRPGARLIGDERSTTAAPRAISHPHRRSA